MTDHYQNLDGRNLDRRIIEGLRKEYRHASLDDHTVDPDPIQQFLRWFHDAVRAELVEPNAMVLATVGAEGRPSSRMMLMKECNPQGFTFFTNYESRKGTELSTSPHGALLFFWSELERQVRVEGSIARTSAETSQRYWATRPRNSRIGSLASPQSRTLADRGVLEARVAQFAQEYPGEHIPCPPHWGGYLLVPDRMEFWQGREDRLHDRVEYVRGDAGGWERRRLAP